uniref:Uncharacterized protein n=1 Tax=Globisporangium ultimum (strain ATCC 200006 / CBS 805.95 / DAOM BR144) TaxID=431595 RepID=K3W5D4_GLOUD
VEEALRAGSNKGYHIFRAHFLREQGVVHLFTAQQQSIELAAPQAQTSEQKHEDIIQYFEKSKIARSSAATSDLKQIASSVTTSFERPQNRSKERIEVQVHLRATNIEIEGVVVATIEVVAVVQIEESELDQNHEAKPDTDVTNARFEMRVQDVIDAKILLHLS